MLTDAQRRARMILQGRLNNTEIAELTGCARNTVRNWRKSLMNSGVGLDDIEGLDDTELLKIVTPGAFTRTHRFEEPDWDHVLFERCERAIDLKRLHSEYVAGVSNRSCAMSLSTFRRLFDQHAERKNVTISFDYEPGEMIQVDFVGRKKAKQPFLINAAGTERDYEIFCAVSVKSRKIYLLAIESQAKLPVLAAFVSMLEFYRGAPVLVTIDNFKAAVSKPRRKGKDAELTPEFQELADHYQFGLKAARVRKPKDKALVENAVGIVQNDVLAPLRNRRFFSLSEMNAAISDLLAALNARPLSGQPNESRNTLFDRVDAPGFRPLPDRRFEAGIWVLKLRAGRDYRVHVAGTPYSVPSRFANEQVRAKLTPTTVHLFHQSKIIATHAREDNAEKPVINPDHMPPAHRQASMARLSGIKSYVHDIGPCAEQFIDEHFRMSRRPDDTANLAMRLRVLTATYSSDRVEAACELARSIGKRSAVTVESILAKGTDRLQIDAIDRPDTPQPNANIRGSSYFAQMFFTGEENGNV